MSKFVRSGFEDLPSVSIIIPTFNSSRTLGLCLKSIFCQDYPRGKVEVIIADGGSTDGTVKIAMGYGVDKILKNPLRTGEAGKAIGFRNASNDIIAFIDSDNVLPEKNWLKRMVRPFEVDSIAGSEPLYFAYRRDDSSINRYFALIGMNDPLCLFIGNYDRYSYLTDKWTGLNVRWQDVGDYLILKLDERALPTVGANGFLVRKGLVNECLMGEYLFDVDLVYELVSKGHNEFAKVKTEIFHLYSDSITTFLGKQMRRISHYAKYKRLGLRKYPWSNLGRLGLIKFISFTLLMLPLLVQTVRGYLRKKDRAWVFHPIACWVTLLAYGWAMLQGYSLRKDLWR